MKTVNLEVPAGLWVWGRRTLLVFVGIHLPELLPYIQPLPLVE